jgi:hypothetical protein
MERSVEIELSADDLAHSFKLQFVTFLRSRRGLIRLGVLALVVSVAFGALIWNGSTSNAVAILTFTLLSPLMVIAGPAAIVWLAAPRSSRRVFSQQASLRRSYHLTWDNEHYRTASESGNAVIAWRDFFRAERDDELITLYESQALRRLIPIRFLSPEQRADIERMIAPLLGK